MLGNTGLRVEASRARQSCSFLGVLIRVVAGRLIDLFHVHRRGAERSVRSPVDGYRGTERCDVETVEDVLVRVSAMVEAHREIVELDCNPLIARPDGAVIVDARVRVQAAAPRPPVPSLAA